MVPVFQHEAFPYFVLLYAFLLGYKDYIEKKIMVLCWQIGF
jgi:hypothetical protein